MSTITEIVNVDGGLVVNADLAALPDQINDAVRAAEGHAGMAVQAALKAGTLLKQAREIVPHGQWESWLTDNCTVAVRTAQAYMRLASKLPALPAESATAVALLPLREAMTAISTAPTSPPRESVYRPSQDDAHRARQIIETCQQSLHRFARDLGCRSLKRDRINGMRDKMLAALAELDRMLGEAQS